MDILIVEDNADLAANIGEYLERCGEKVDFAADGLVALHRAATGRFDAIVLDVGLPGISGLEVCRRIRRDAGYDTPILLLTARDTERDKLDGFAAGADDYLTKPFSLAELHARLLAATRRHGRHGHILAVGDLVYDHNTHIARRGDRRLNLTPTGIRLLRLLLEAAPGVVTRADIEREIWGEDVPRSEASLRGHIQALRAAIDSDDDTRLLHTLHGIGYRIAKDEDR